MTILTFISDPSLAKKHSRHRNLLLATVNSHVAKTGHEKRQRTKLQQKKNQVVYTDPSTCRSDEGDGEDQRSLTPSPTLELRTRYSEHLEASYHGNDECLINNLFSYCMAQILALPIAED